LFHHVLPALVIREKIIPWSIKRVFLPQVKLLSARLLLSLLVSILYHVRQHQRHMGSLEVLCISPNQSSFPPRPAPNAWSTRPQQSYYPTLLR
jgi:hypothetical protein